METHNERVIEDYSETTLQSPIPDFCDDRATTNAGSISQGNPDAEESSYTFIATCTG